MSSSSSSSSSAAGMGFTGGLLILFIALKLLGKIAWSWWWVLSPAWIAAGITGLILAAIVITAVIKTRDSSKAR